ncbi:Cob(I)yrinic acid a%2Cc-diamide adenosyltransferase [uncultured Roseburia sp.]|uniref:Cob(I)yrinic acid a,c-diamide adenosyltransferase n=1 Tax=Brotonthovivens ammoniilytica TaxID=2981725 RepID=A0ABT2TJV2_9FIRM|nr:cob(I)yrinic acid a,c-diamide adenosyltransferase [Brotonthovivens ammoniilytica]MCU6762502.1 cob(I)yrinic acid a,c-diamide adenosyltransferase [Brotonthovivens ammoniilytica]SCI74038.1 Cob(I)yrinic acid a%2Cc-diamide adenosyltransferase [uncultured Roseburia sp.]
MEKGKVQAYYGYGRGKTTAALGYAIHEASKGGNSFIIQFLKGKDDDEISFIRRLEPEIKLFRFQKSADLYDNLSTEEQFEEKMNMKNGVNYARKVLATGECSMLILDEVLGLIDKKVITVEELIALIQVKSEETTVILTGRVLNDALIPYLDEIYRIQTEKD